LRGPFCGRPAFSPDTPKGDGFNSFQTREKNFRNLSERRLTGAIADKGLFMTITSVAEEPVLSVAEVTEIIENLSDADFLRIKKISQYLSYGGARSPAELRQEAIKRALGGTRKCPRRLEIVPFLYGTMRSIASADRKAIGRSPELHLVPKQGSSAGSILDGVDPRLSPEDRILKDEEFYELKNAILPLFDDDPVAQTLAEGMIEGMEGQELREFVGLNEKDFATARRLIRRRIDKAFPHGWKR
jgi:RNA polymerase sigma-70 factor (ECF subfamily)